MKRKLMKGMWLMVAAVSMVCVTSTKAIVVDLTAGGSGSANGADFVWVDQQSTGTGIIDPFVRIQANRTEEGYNTDLAPMPDVKTGKWTHDIQLGAIPIVNGSYEFLLDINEDRGGDHEFISLYEVEIWLRGSPLTVSGDTYGDLSGSGATKMYDLDVGSDGDSRVELNYLLNPGSGAGDMFMYVPTSILGTDGSKYLYLYSAFGNPNSTSDGFEEWAVRTGTTSVPDGGMTLTLLGAALVGLGIVRRKIS